MVRIFLYTLITYALSIFLSPCANAREALSVAFPADITVKLNATANTRVTDWYYSSESTVGTYVGHANDGSVTPQFKYMYSTAAKVPGINGEPVDVVDLGNGIGIAAEGQFKHPDGSWGQWLNSARRNDSYPWKYGDRISARLAVALVRLNGSISPGHVDVSEKIDGYFEGLIYQDTKYSVHGIGTSGGFSLRAPTCQIQTKDIRVNMGNGISTSTFKKLGNRSSPVAFGVSMTCPAGINKLHYQLNPAGGSKIVGKPQNGTISLSNQGGQGDAFGVGVYIENGNPSTPLPLGQDIQINQYNPIQDSQQIQTNFTASYIQTAPNVKGGEANAKATYTLSYE
ncbi:Fimbrial protein [Burkholderia ambifaria IOP40-10]|uniref:Fimbrial protein n=1 Tax=Burkholderia ambifaria IOP40-10 TaxID=396596 RepID=B1FH48_9BURK|nr:fimbrial protein [Burkholderia ambifaria]EDT03132.1 Fimbrial protein [Burkholderia ambifaria IOP40-10]